MIKETIFYRQFALEVIGYQFFELAFQEHVVISMVDGGLLLLVWYGSFYKTRLLWVGFLLFFGFLAFLVGVLQVPLYEDVLLLELLMLLFVGPDIYQDLPTDPQYPVELRNCLDSQRIRAEMMHDRDRDNPVNAIGSHREKQ